MLFESIFRHSRFKWILLGATSFVIATWLYFGHYLDNLHISKISALKSITTEDASKASPPPPLEEGLPWPKAPNEVWQKLSKLLDENAPNVPTPSLKDPFLAKSVEYDPKKDGPLMDALNMAANDVLSMREKHRNFVEQLGVQFPNYVPTQGAAKRGIVTVAGGYHFPIFFVSLRMLRRTGTQLPVEVFLPDQSEYEKEICEDILPQFNAKCHVLTDIMNHHGGTDKEPVQIKKFQYKIFSILFSSFDEVLFLDSDCFAVQNPDPLFVSNPFTETGMITWPDFWASSASAFYYIISNQKPPLLSDRATMESGQILVNKRTHHHTLLLSAYYNYFGPDMYYELLCQGGAGKGDKETFHPAALALNKPFYAVSEPVKAVGHPKSEPGKFFVFAMIQHDPLQDYERVQHNREVKQPLPYFVHANTPKWNAKNVFDHSLPYDLTWDLQHNEVSAFMVPKENVAEIAGVERQMWEELKWVGCELEHKFKDFEDSDKKGHICEKIKDYFARVLDKDKPPEQGEAKQEGEKSVSQRDFDA
jgi:alpha 1,2-mannosyltransferase